ncbi:MAG: hypothetical protein M1840_003957 [Geoglossum simile]|nr:MAG: hypothetical protein M1840_003957 [Geoglossum simile]
MEDSDQTSCPPTPTQTGTDGRDAQCVDLSALATTHHGASNHLETADELCAACREIDLAGFVGQYCGAHKYHYHLGKVEDIQLKKGCAFCRLISAVYNSAHFRAPVTSSENPLSCILGPSKDFVTIEIQFSAVSASERTDRSTAPVIRQCGEDSRTLGNPKLRGRLIQPHQADFGLIREWLQSCETSHGGICGRYRLECISQPARTIRLVDVLNRQIVDSTVNERYLALSYVWGEGNQMCLSRQNHGYLQERHGLKDANMPKTIKDEIDVVTRVGERYLWVDRLCILMDDEQDKLEQMSHMDQIFSAATLTIVAPSARCSNSLLPGVGPDSRPSLKHSEVIRGVRYVITQPDPALAVLGLNWRTRGWTYQEAFLSSRCLIFTPYQVYFQCRSEAWCEDSWGGGEGQVLKPSTGNPLCHLRDYSSINRIYRCSFYQYADAAEGFSSGSLTVDTDALWAFTGILKAFQPRFQDGFVWGLPLESLDAALLWCSFGPSGVPRDGFHTEMVDSHKKDEAIMDEQALGFLRFTAESANFDVEVNFENCHKNHPDFVPCSIRACAGEVVGYIGVPTSWLETRSDKRGEFILMSLHIKTEESETCQGINEDYPGGGRRFKGVEHVDGCGHQSIYNILLIDWKKGPRGDVATRIGVAQILKNNWAEAKASPKLIVLN